MKRLPRALRNRAALLLAFTAGTLQAALTPTEWQHRQTVTVPAAGLVKIALSPATFDAAQPGLADLRMLDAEGREVASLLDRDLTPAGFKAVPAVRPHSIRTIPGAGSTQLLIETGNTAELDALFLETSAPFFLKAAHAEVSADGAEWRSLGPTVPVFRHFGAEQLRLALGRHQAAFIRITLDDSHSRPVIFSGAKLQPAAAFVTPPSLHFGARIGHRDEFAGETVLTVLLDGRHAPLTSLSLETDAPLFMRRVTVAVREMQGDVSGERVVATGTIYRLALEGAAVREQLHVPLDFSATTRELLVHIHNADSPPLAIRGVSAWQHPVHLFFHAPAAGNYTLLSGNPQAAPPRYDLAAFAGDLRKASGTTLTAGPLEAMPNYRARESLAEAPLPDVPLAGAPLDTSDWPVRRVLTIARAGVQELELDPAALAQSRADGADLRLLRGGNQIPYILERPALARSLALTPVAAPDPKRPGVSVWKLQLPQPGLPLSRVVLTSPTALFQRQFRLYEKAPGTDGGTMELNLAAGGWSRTPEPGAPETRIFDLPDRLRTDTIWIETDNGDNPPITLGPVQAVHPVVRLIFKVAETDGFTLAYGNRSAAAPRYDLSLVAVKLLTASRHGVQLDDAGAPPADQSGRFAGLKSGYIFWGALALVVAVLLFVVAKMLPKPPAG